MLTPAAATRRARSPPSAALIVRTAQAGRWRVSHRSKCAGTVEDDASEQRFFVQLVPYLLWLFTRNALVAQQAAPAASSIVDDEAACGRPLVSPRVTELSLRTIEFGQTRIVGAYVWPF